MSSHYDAAYDGEWSDAQAGALGHQPAKEPAKEPAFNASEWGEFLFVGLPLLFALVGPVVVMLWYGLTGQWLLN